MLSVRVKLSRDGRMVIPAADRRALGLAAGDQVVVSLEDGALRVRTVNRAIRDAQQLVRQYIPAERSLSDELIAERRAEAARE